MYTDNALLFPRTSIQSLRGLRGQKWDNLVERVIGLPECHEETLAFMLMMINLNGCVGCETDSFRAMKGCNGCACQTIRRYKGSDEDLLKLYDDALEEIRSFASRGTPVARLIQTNVISLTPF